MNSVTQSKRYKTVNCTNIPVKPTIPKLIALLGTTLPRRECSIEILKSQTTAISNFELPYLLGLNLRGSSKTFNLPLLIASNSYKNLKPLTSILFIYEIHEFLLKTKNPLK